MSKDSGTDNDRSRTYADDELVRVLEDFLRNLPPAKRLYPDLYTEELAATIRGTRREVREDLERIVNWAEYRASAVTKNWLTPAADRLREELGGTE